jgi:hypothetical protein
MVLRVFYIKQVQNKILKVDLDDNKEGLKIPSLGPPDKWTPLMFEPSSAEPSLELPEKYKASAKQDNNPRNNMQKLFTNSN